MCGVNVIVDRTLELDHTSIERMNQAISSRGPDGTGVHVLYLQDKQVFFGNTRLGIRGEGEDMHQPLISGSGVISYNGEIYSSTQNASIPQNDTRFLLDFLSREGVSELGKLNGMFAFAFYPIGADELWIGRDSHGIKPLFFYESEKYTIVSSEIKGILATGLVKPTYNDSQIRESLQVKHPKRPETIYEAIKEVEPGTCLEVFSGEKVQYRTPLNNSENRSLRRIWEDEIKQQLVAERPIGIFLSGGIDSALILAAVNELGYKDIPSYSISNDANELKQIEKVVSVFSSKHQNYSIDPSWDDWINFVSHMDQPIGDSGAFLTYLLSQKASREISVALSGAGADEYLAGYNRHLAFKYYLKGGAPLRILAGLGRAASIHKLLGKEYARLGSKFLNAVSDNPQQTYANFVSTLPSAPLAVKTLDDALEYDRKQYLISDVLAISDLTSMAHGLELRVPFLGQDVTSFARSKTAEELLRKGRKWILKELLIECGGKELIDYPKKGFGIDYQTLVQLKIHDQLFSLDFRTVLSDYVDQVYIDLLLKNPEKMDISLLWNLMITAHWLEQHR